MKRRVDKPNSAGVAREVVDTLRVQLAFALQIVRVIDRGAINPSGALIAASGLAALFEPEYKHPKRGVVTRILVRAGVPDVGQVGKWYRRDIVAARDSIEAVAQELFQELQKAEAVTSELLHLERPPSHWADARRTFCGKRASILARVTNSIHTFERESPRCGQCEARYREREKE